MDVAASEFYKDGKYDLDFKSPDDSSRYITHDQLANIYKSFVDNYPGQFLLGLNLMNEWAQKVFITVSCLLKPSANTLYNAELPVLWYLTLSDASTAEILWYGVNGFSTLALSWMYFCQSSPNKLGFYSVHLP